MTNTISERYVAAVLERLEEKLNMKINIEGDSWHCIKE